MARKKHMAYEMAEETIDQTIEKIIRNDLTFDEAMQELKDNSLVSAFFSESELEKIVSDELRKEVLQLIPNFTEINELPKRPEIYDSNIQTNFESEEILIKELDYYYTNSISRASKTMSECRQIKKNNKKKYGTNN